jgi:damage-control phosphatase, subfamily I
MKTCIDCLPCFLRQALDAARMVSPEPVIHERIIREVVRWIGEMDLHESPPVTAQRIHRRLREITGVEDPYRAAKDHFNRMALSLLPELRIQIKAAPDPLNMAVRLAIAGNVIDMGAHSQVTEADVRESCSHALQEPFTGDMSAFRQSAAEARSILYLADNAGEIVFDRLLIEQLMPAPVTLAVRGAPVINDATLTDARAAGLHDIVEVIDNGSDAPGTILEDCSRDFNRRFIESDMIIAKGQGNFESLSEEKRSVYFLFKAKCPVIAADVGLPIGSHVLARTGCLHWIRESSA